MRVYGGFFDSLLETSLLKLQSIPIQMHTPSELLHFNELQFSMYATGNQEEFNIFLNSITDSTHHICFAMKVGTHVARPNPPRPVLWYISRVTILYYIKM